MIYNFVNYSQTTRNHSSNRQFYLDSEKWHTYLLQKLTNLPLGVATFKLPLTSIWSTFPYPPTAKRIATSVIMAFLKPPFLTLRSKPLAVALF